MEKVGEKKTLFVFGGTVLIVAAVVLMLWFFMRGETKVTGGYIGEVKSRSINCILDNFDYPFFTYDNAEKKTTEINVVFNNEDMKSISLIQKMYYSDKQSAGASSAVNHAAMNKSFGSELGADALNANYNVSDEVMRFSIYADGSEFSVATWKYFLIEAQLKNIEDYEENYTNQGFNCVEKNN